MLYRCCCGLDVHKETAVACLLRSGAAGQPAKEARTFGTTAPELLALGDWLRAVGGAALATESTGAHRTPV